MLALQAESAQDQTAFGNLETHISTIHDLGAFWFLEKPVQSQALKVLLERAARHGKLEEHAERKTEFFLVRLLLATWRSAIATLAW